MTVYMVLVIKWQNLYSFDSPFVKEGTVVTVTFGEASRTHPITYILYYIKTSRFAGYLIME